MTHYDIWQQIFGISMSSNALAQESGKKLDELQKKAESDIPAAIKTYGSWEVVFGPVVWQSSDNQDGAPDNVWFAAKKKGLNFPDTTSNAYVVAIAASAAHSYYDKVQESLIVQPIVDLTAWIDKGLTTTPEEASKDDIDDSKNTYISVGTAWGLHAIVSTKVPSGGTAVEPGKLLGDWLATIPSGARLIFTGHSLGAAIAPVLAAAWLKSSMTKKVTKKDVYTYLTAGPGPWNENFKKLFESTFTVPSGSNLKGHKYWNTNIINTRDIIPQAWCTDPELEPNQNLGRIINMWPSGWMDITVMDLVIQILTMMANTSGIVYRPLKASSFTGTGTMPYAFPDDQAPLVDGEFLPQWMGNAVFQHITEYLQEFGLGGSDKETEKTTQTTKARKDVTRAMPFIKSMLNSSEAATALKGAPEKSTE